MKPRYNTKIQWLALCALFAGAAQAADVGAGKAKSAACQSCHGPVGVSSGPLWPSLAGLNAGYIEGQLVKFRSGMRDDPVMRPIAEELGDADMQNLAAYFSSLQGKSAGGDPALAKLGKDKAGMCLGCHGNNAQGVGMAPKLAGQQPKYLAKQLTDFKKGARKAPQMNAMAQSLSDDDIKALAAYLASL